MKKKQVKKKRRARPAAGASQEAVLTAEFVTAELLLADDKAAYLQALLLRLNHAWQFLDQASAELMTGDFTDQVEALIEAFMDAEIGMNDELAEVPIENSDSTAIVFRKLYARLDAAGDAGLADEAALELAGQTLVAMSNLFAELKADRTLLQAIVDNIGGPSAELELASREERAGVDPDELPIEYLDEEELLRRERDGEFDENF